jgi:hypothetical protein
VPDPAAGAAVVVLCGAAELGAAVAAGAVVAGWPAVVAVAAVALRLGRLLAALLIAPLTVLPAPAQPAAPTARQTATRIAAGRERLFAERRMSILPWPRTAAMDEAPVSNGPPRRPAGASSATEYLAASTVPTG